MKIKFLLFHFFLVSTCLISCNAKKDSQGGTRGVSNSASNTETKEETAISSDSGSGTISFSLDGTNWSDNTAIATQTGSSFLNIASTDSKTEAISIIVDHPATGSFSFNSGVNGSYTDPSGLNYGSLDGSGQIIISGYMAPSGKTPGHVEGTFKGTFNSDTNHKVLISDGKFSMPVRGL